MGTLPVQYYERLIGSTFSDFSNLVMVGEKIEEGLKTGKISGGNAGTSTVKKPFNGFKRKKLKPMLCMNQGAEEEEDNQLDLLLFRSRICHILMLLLCNFLAFRISNPGKCRCLIQLKFLRIKL